MAGARGSERDGDPETAIGGGVPFDHQVVVGLGNAVRAETNDQLGEAIGTGDEVAVRIDFDQRYVDGVMVGELDAQHVARLRLHHGPGRHAAELDVVAVAELAIDQIAIGDQLAGGDRVAGGVELILAQEHLVRGSRGVGLVLVDERRGLVEVLVDVVGALVDKGRRGLSPRMPSGPG